MPTGSYHLLAMWIVAASVLACGDNALSDDPALRALEPRVAVLRGKLQKLESVLPAPGSERATPCPADPSGAPPEVHSLDERLLGDITASHPIAQNEVRMQATSLTSTELPAR